MLVGDCAEAYYSHPWAWDEIGYGGLLIRAAICDSWMDNRNLGKERAAI